MRVKDKATLKTKDKALQLGKNIAEARKAKHLSQNALSNILGVSREHLAKIETAKRGISINLLFKIADTLEISEQELFAFS